MAPVYGPAMSPDQSSDLVVAIPVAALVSAVLALVSVSICACCRKKPKQYVSTTEEPVSSSPAVPHPIPEATEQDPSIITAKSPPSLIVEKVESSDREPNPDEAKSFKLTSFQFDESSLRQVGGGWTPNINEQRPEMTEEKTGQRPMKEQLQLQSKRVESRPAEPEKQRPAPEGKEISDMSIIGGRPAQEPSLRSAVPATSVGTQPAIATVKASSAMSTATTRTMPESASRIFVSSKTAAVTKSIQSPATGSASRPTRPQEVTVPNQSQQESVSTLPQQRSISARLPETSASTRLQHGSVSTRSQKGSTSLLSEHDSVSHGSASSLMEGSARKGMDHSGSLGFTSASEMLGEKSDRIMLVPTRPFVDKKRRM